MEKQREKVLVNLTMLSVAQLMSKVLDRGIYIFTFISAATEKLVKQDKLLGLTSKTLT